MSTRYICAIVIFLLSSVEGLAATSVVVSPVREMANDERVQVNGVVRSRNDIVLSAETEGQLQFVVDEGAHVSRGTVIARIDAEPLALRLREQQLLTQRAQVNLDYLNAEVERLTMLESRNLTARTQLAEMKSRRDLAANDVEVSQARARQTEEDIRRAEITSPVDGVIVARLRQAGEFARRGEPLVRVVDDHDLEIRAAMPVSVFDRLEPGADVTVSISSLRFEAGLQSIIAAGDENSQTFNVLVRVPAELAPGIVPGQFAEVEVPLSARELSLFVPRDAVVLRGDGSYVFRIDDKNRANRVNVVLGRGQGDLVAVTGDLENGDRVAIRGVERLEDGQQVDPDTG